jgi:hypothetical protein
MIFKKMKKSCPPPQKVFFGNEILEERQTLGLFNDFLGNKHIMWGLSLDGVVLLRTKLTTESSWVVVIGFRILEFWNFIVN